jgi:hypothetical protein
MTGEHLESEGKIVEVPVSISYTALLLSIIHSTAKIFSLPLIPLQRVHMATLDESLAL